MFSHTYHYVLMLIYIYIVYIYVYICAFNNDNDNNENNNSICTHVICMHAFGGGDDREHCEGALHLRCCLRGLPEMLRMGILL